MTVRDHLVKIDDFLRSTGAPTDLIEENARAIALVDVQQAASLGQIRLAQDVRLTAEHARIIFDALLKTEPNLEIDRLGGYREEFAERFLASDKPIVYQMESGTHFEVVFGPTPVVTMTREGKGSRESLAVVQAALRDAANRIYS